MSRRFCLAMVAVMLTLGATACGGSGNSSSVTTYSTAVTTASAPASWRNDPRCSLEKLLVTEVALMDDGLIPDNAQNESSSHVLAVVKKAERAGGDCDAVRQRMRVLLGS